MREQQASVGDERARLFVALELPDEVRDALLDWRQEALHGIHDLRLTEAQNLHVTLCFLGWQTLADVTAIGAACREIPAAGLPDLELSEAVWLPARRPRVLAVELVDFRGILGVLQGALSAAFERGGWYTPERRPFLPHVTVARVRAGGRLKSRRLEAPPTLGFAPAGLTLYRSHLARAGARYEPLARIGLAASDS